MKRQLPEPLDLKPSRDRSIADRALKTAISEFREPARPGATIAELLDSLPDFLGARNLRDLAA
jgi:hypothetical protein